MACGKAKRLSGAPADTVIDANQIDRVIHMGWNVQITLENLTFTGNSTVSPSTTLQVIFSPIIADLLSVSLLQ